jgi:hypothetical protein
MKSRTERRKRNRGEEDETGRDGTGVSFSRPRREGPRSGCGFVDDGYTRLGVGKAWEGRGRRAARVERPPGRLPILGVAGKICNVRCPGALFYTPEDLDARNLVWKNLGQGPHRVAYGRRLVDT